MTSFDDEFAAAAFPDLLAQFGELIMYQPASGAARQIAAVVDVSELAGNDATPEAPTHTVIVWALADASGVPPAGIVIGIDRFEVILFHGGDPVWVTAQQIIGDDGGVVQILCQ